MKNKRILSLVLSAVMVLTMLVGVSPTRASAAGPVTVSAATWGELKAAVTAAPADGTLTVINVTADLTADSNCTVDVNKNILIQNAGGTYTITRDTSLSGLSVFDIDNGADLTLKNITLDGNGTNFTATSPLLYAACNTFTLDGATIKNAKANCIGGSAGVHMTLGNFSMKNGAKITDCANISASGAYGGAIFMNGGCSLIISDNCAIQNNQANYGGGICAFSGATVNLSGSPDISGNTKADGTTPCNLYLNSGAVVNADALLSQTNPIGITTYPAPTTGTPADVTSATNSSDLSNCFVSDSPDYYINNTSSGSTQQVKLYLIPTVMTWADLCTEVGNASTDGTISVINVTADLTANSTCSVDNNKKIVIQSSGGPFTITRGASFNGMIFLIGTSPTSHGNLTLKNITVDGNDAHNPNANNPMVYMSNGEFTMDGATLQNATANTIFSPGVLIQLNDTMTMKNGASIDNIVNTNNADGSGAIYCVGTLNMDGCSVTNSKGYYGGVVFAGTFNLSGNPTISGNTKADGTTPCNVNLAGCVVTVSGTLTNTTPIGITTFTPPTLGQPTNVTAVSSADWSGKFTSDSASYSIQNSGSGSTQSVQLAVIPFATVTVNKNSAAWLTGTPTIKLSTQSTSSAGAISGVLTNGVYAFTVPDPSQTYYVWDVTNNKYTGQSVANGSSNVTLDYYSVQFAVSNTGTASGSTISAAYDGSSISSGAVVLGGKQLDITATGAGSSNYTYLWSGAGTSGQTSAALTISSLGGAVNASCVVNSKAPKITTASLPDGVVGMAYTQSLAALTLGTITWSVTSGSLPSGLILDQITGAINGTPTSAGTSSFAVTATNAFGSDTKTLSITINAAAVAPAITTDSLSGGMIGAAYSQTLAATGTAPMTWTITSGSLPAGLSLDSGTGAITGTPTTAGTGTFTVRASNGGGSDTKAYSISIAAVSYALTVQLNGGSGSTVSGAYTSGALVSIDAGSRSGYVFSGWTSSNGGAFADPSSAATTFTMPGNATTITAAWTPYTGGGGGGSITPSNNNTIVIVDGTNYSIGTENKNGPSTLATVDQGKLTEEIAQASGSSSVVFPVSANTNVTAQLVVRNVEDMAQKNMILTVRTGSVSYNLNTSAIDTAKITSSLGDADSNNIPFNVSISDSNAVVSGAMVVVSPVTFTVTATYNGKTVTVDTFSSFVNRTVEITAEQAEKITTAVVVQPDGILRHVPTKVAVIGGKYYAVINSLTNSTYTAIWNHVVFSDVSNHWAKDAVNDMGSRMIVTGIGGGLYEPDRDITRAEFATIVVRALGLDKGMGTNVFTDVKAGAWCRGYIETAVGYGLINGYGDGTFGPNDPITREQAMALVARAMKITGLKPVLTDSEADALLADYADSLQVADYARVSIADCLKTGIILGRSNGNIAPKEYITRAEVATIIQRLLQQSDLI